MRDPLAVPRLIKLLHNENKKIRKAASTALSEMREPSATEPLTIAFQDEDKKVRIAATEALDKLRDAITDVYNKK